MTEKRYSSAKKQYESYSEFVQKIRDTLDYGFVSFLLKAPIPLKYEFWCFLHKIKGDWIE